MAVMYIAKRHAASEPYLHGRRCPGQLRSHDASLSAFLSIDKPNSNSLHALLQQLVEFVDLAGNTGVDSTLADLNDQAAEDAGVDVRDDLQLLALAELGLADGSFNALESLRVEFLVDLSASCVLPTNATV